MNLLEEIADTQTKAQREMIAAWIGKDRGRFKQLMEVVFSDDRDLARKAAWPMSQCLEEHPQLASPYLPEMVRCLGDPKIHQGVRRNIARSFQVIELPEELLAGIFDTCFERLTDPDEAIAVRAYSITILTRICQREPALKDEVILAIERGLPQGTAAYRARAGMALRELKSLHGK